MLGLLLAAWLCVGVYGVVAYGHNYYTYRGFAPPHDPSGVSHGRVLHEHFWSLALHQRRSYLIYLPPGYERDAARGMRFPVLYMLHGSPGGGSLFINAAGMGVSLDRLVSARRVRPFLIVAPNGSDGTFTSDTEWADTPHGLYETLALETVQAVDKRWPTLADRRDRGLGGNSEGAYAAINLGLRHLDTFSVAESWSGYFTQRRHGPFAHATPELIAGNSPSAYVPLLAGRLHAISFHAFIYAGSSEVSVPAERAFAAELRRAGAHVTFRVFAGGHDWQLWRAEADRMILYAGRLFAAG